MVATARVGSRGVWGEEKRRIYIPVCVCVCARVLVGARGADGGRTTLETTMSSWGRWDTYSRWDPGVTSIGDTREDTQSREVLREEERTGKDSPGRVTKWPQVTVTESARQRKKIKTHEVLKLKPRLPRALLKVFFGGFCSVFLCLWHRSAVWGLQHSLLH